jgi:type I restriction enzyme R subunit
MENPKSTVVAEYVPDVKKAVDYQSEAALEQEFIETLESQAYERLNITTDVELIANLRKQLTKLNDYEFSDNEWKRFFDEFINKPTLGIVEKTRIIQDNYIKNLICDDGTTKNIHLLNKKNVHRNCLQVINQYTVNGIHKKRYDVTVLVNGFPLVHIELKRRGVNLKEAFNQIMRYQDEGFIGGSRLFEYVQIFVISNGTYTKYYSNTTRDAHVKQITEKAEKAVKKTSNSYMFTSSWADASNRPIDDLIAFAQTFFAKHTLLAMLIRYCVFTSYDMLLVMRPYQVVACERILNKILISTNSKQVGTIHAGGYIWHTTGSGKTLTSFKTAQLATAIDGVDKVLFVVDRKDLDYQTMKEYDKFAKGAANSNISTRILTEQLTKRNGAMLESGELNQPIIVTTIQKLNQFIRNNPIRPISRHPIYSKHAVIIFDECHRSQFGAMHSQIKRAFRNSHLFGFTGTPIFSSNAWRGGDLRIQTTEQVFGAKLHSYTILDAINDKNVLRLRVEYYSTMHSKYRGNERVPSIDKERALLADERINDVVRHIREHFGQKTKQNYFYTVGNQRRTGFNSLFAVQSIKAAKKYYTEFKRQDRDVSPDQRLSIAIIYSFSPNQDQDEVNGLLSEEDFEVVNLDPSSRKFLDSAIDDYNKMFNTQFDTSADKFQNYYTDLSNRIKNQDIDLTIVVNMFLTGFDATTLNTLWVDKHLRQHGLLQAFSRTNRILNNVKTHGNIVCFRDLSEEVSEAVALFGNRETTSALFIEPYDELYANYEQLITELIRKFPLGQRILGESAKKEFVQLYGAIVRAKNVLQDFDEFQPLDEFGNRRDPLPAILHDRDFQNYQSMYLDLHDEFRPRETVERVDFNDDLVFEIELIKQEEINIDYILMQTKKRFDSGLPKEEIKERTRREVSASFGLRSKKDLIDAFITQMTGTLRISEDWQTYIGEQEKSEFAKIVKDENLNPDKAKQFIENAFRDGWVQWEGTEIMEVLPSVHPRARDSGEIKLRVLSKLQAFFDRFEGLGGKHGSI